MMRTMSQGNHLLFVGIMRAVYSRREPYFDHNSNVRLSYLGMSDGNMCLGGEDVRVGCTGVCKACITMKGGVCMSAIFYGHCMCVVYC